MDCKEITAKLAEMRITVGKCQFALDSGDSTNLHLCLNVIEAHISRVRAEMNKLVK